MAEEKPFGKVIGDMLAKPGEDVPTLGDIIKEHNERSSETRVDVDNGKYTVVMPDKGGLYALRHGEQWRDYVGDSLVWCLAAELRDAREKIKEDKQRLQSMINLTNTQEEEIKKLNDELDRWKHGGPSRV